jgi:hypothetical protein
MKEIKSYNNKHDPQKKIIETLSLLTVEIMGLKRDMVSYQNILKNQNVVLAELVKETTRLSDNMDALLSSIAEDYDNLEDMSLLQSRKGLLIIGGIIALIVVGSILKSVSGFMGRSFVENAIVHLANICGHFTPIICVRSSGRSVVDDIV